MIWRGPWIEGEQYGLGDVVSRLGQAYIATTDGLDDVAPEDSVFWDLLASRGAPGPVGIQGNEGPQGVIGAEGQKGDTGDAGPVGSTGAKGDTGDAGPAGSAGPKGDTGDAGPTGAKGDTGDAGATGLPGLTWEGTWSPIGNYAENDAVSHNGSSYIAIQSTPAGTTPPNTTYWDTLAQAGEDGSSGGSGSSDVRFVIAGTTSSIFAGNAGYRAINAACETDFGAGARMATSLDLLKNPPAVAPTSNSFIQGIAHPSDVAIEGFSTATMTGSAGYFGMVDACRDTYGADARLATSEEVTQSSLDVNQSGVAWVQGIAHPSDPATDTITGISSGTNLTCTGWSDSGSNLGLTVNGSTYSMATQFCYQSAAIACSIPQ